MRVKDMTSEQKKAKIAEMSARYQEIAFTNNYLVGFEHNGNILYVTGGFELISEKISLQETSTNTRGEKFAALRYAPDKAYYEKLAKLPTEKILCTVAEFEKEKADCKAKGKNYNAGEIFEKIVTEKLAGKIWKKDNLKFTECADVTINGIPYQVKYGRASICNEKNLE